jgi:hypothetical protein
MVHNLGEGRQLANDPGLPIFLLAAMRLGATHAYGAIDTSRLL